MPPAYRDARTFFAALFGMAEELRETLIPLSDIERAKLVTEIIRESDMVFGVWPDEDGPDGFGVQIIKGEATMPPLDAFETDDEFRIAAIPCVGLEQALAAWDEWKSRRKKRQKLRLQRGPRSRWRRQRGWPKHHRPRAT